jgi:hypothetical protein
MRSIVAIAALVIITPAWAGTIPLSELQVGHIASGERESRVIKQMGEPTKRVETGEGTELRYPGLVVTVGWLDDRAPNVERRVAALKGTGHRACTPRGLCPGMPISVAKRLYGAGEMIHRSYGTFLEFYPREAGCWLQVSVYAGFVRSVGVACSP